MQAIFPLPMVLFPGGVSQLKIFEPRYLRMVAQAQEHNGFIIVTEDHNCIDGISHWGCEVSIVDFESLPGELLGIEIQAKRVVEVTIDHIAKDKLTMGFGKALAHWESGEHNSSTWPLAEKLRQLFDCSAQLQHFYPHPRFDDVNWTCARWIELLPLKATDKRLFYCQNSFGQAVDLLRTIVLAEKIQNN